MDHLLTYCLQIINPLVDLEFPLHSRVHPLKTYNNSHLQCYVKRDDELGLMGTKMRKYSSLVPALLRQKVDEAILIGGISSNHILGLTQLLIENSIIPTLFLYENKQKEFKGNALLTQLLISLDQVHWIPREKWNHAYEIASNYVHSQKSKIIPEGGLMPESLPGALTLPLDIVRNEKTLQQSFDHIFVDAGTGMTAIALILGLAFLQHPAHVHVILMAGEEQEFMKNLEIYRSHFERLMKKPISSTLRFSMYRPHQAQSFGSTNAHIFKTIGQIAREEGILCDPVYNAKLMIEAKRILQQNSLKGNALVIQSGGTLSLLGFLKKDPKA